MTVRNGIVSHEFTKRLLGSQRVHKCLASQLQAIFDTDRPLGGGMSA